MDGDDCNGRSYISASGDSSLEREFSGALGGPTVSTPNSKETSPSRSLSANSIKVELYSDEDPGRSTEDERGERVEEGGSEQGSEAAGGYRELTNPETMPAGATRLPNGKLKCDICGMICIGPNVLMVHKRSHTGERPFQCNQCGASFTQKGNLLRHIKLHSGEKPFKCPFCSYACRRRDALTGHLRTHAVSSPTVGKPYKCSYCGRSYKQQSTLEEHRERCHSYLQSLESKQLSSAQNPGEEMRELEFIPGSLLQPSADKMAFIDRLANSITKRKRSTPQKFVGQKHIRLNLGDAPYELRAGLDKDGAMQTGDLEAPHFTSLGGEYTGIAGHGGGVSETLRPLHLPTTHPSCLQELRGIHSSSRTTVALGPRLDCTGTGTGLGAGVGGREAAEGHEDLPVGRSHAPSPSNGCQDSTDTESMADEPCISTALTQTLHSNNGHHLLYSNNHNPVPPPIAHHRSRDRHSPSHAKESEVEREDGGNSAPPPTALAATPSSPTAPSSTSREAFRVVDGEGRAVRSFRCEHCRVLFLDHVMFTIHMGCHGFRQPFECNICGHRSQDRYEFSSHIVRGEHLLD
ncbi:putative zinc finger protein Eos [Scophthalmus maximus]|uniref:Putative zinc finger protein Eos n=1 Tax=Scophthalmus maximus TaxID=52904 RepID=A0A2U9BFY5_SCOMX|nr:zinc finger protein Eos-like isoform X1 [Scophthalmus maximus]XP_035486328.1 zinc finger protein Eos-like isoform X1 [Scophthalmus maximus]XP_035486329.1 zinc finger protein Eos-like isoform X1 [Scophthalmus maximus]XP_035486330.1 zinc finger protein Eos-like isoform X1 [Scophthalmus maximus]AWP02935.1 putative zinc finger protein Eos [Scophthalmus maximus]